MSSRIKPYSLDLIRYIRLLCHLTTRNDIFIVFLKLLIQQLLRYRKSVDFQRRIRIRL